MTNEPCLRAWRSFVIRILAFVILVPAGLFGHGAEFLSAKLTLLPDAQVRLEITADYGGNPLIADEAAAQEALQDPIRLRLDETLLPLAHIATGSFSKHDKWAEFAPAAYLPSDAEAQPHTLVTAAWCWRSESPEIVFEMPRGKLHDVLLWTHDEANPAAPPKWMLLLAGDRSKAIPVHWLPWWQRWQTVTASSLFVLALAYFVSRNFTLPQRTL